MNQVIFYALLTVCAILGLFMNIDGLRKYFRHEQKYDRNATETAHVAHLLRAGMGACGLWFFFLGFKVDGINPEIPLYLAVAYVAVHIAAVSCQILYYSTRSLCEIYKKRR
ncbi:hypothetical protein IPH19_02995 [Candidatus Uhrbacteria bacterium]|nr:MAG: hypothetical protein IPH19_02995 [Candidatus Uhrbacteria bacterium]